MRLTTHIDPLTRLRVSEAIPPFPLYAFLGCTGTVYEQLYFFHLTEMCGQIGNFSNVSET
jgi:hypothetical protein